ncbi:hypothetical protein KM043_008244 [Ampulex compressa]|nr:hypothetical protein KM043_008244 [Ampulex compressa]
MWPATRPDRWSPYGLSGSHPPRRSAVVRTVPPPLPADTWLVLTVEHPQLWLYFGCPPTVALSILLARRLAGKDPMRDRGEFGGRWKRELRIEEKVST